MLNSRSVLIVCVIAAISHNCFVTAAYDQPILKLMAKRQDDRVQVRVEKNRTVISIDSPFDISHLDIERTAESWPQPILLQLNLQGLEKLSITNQQLTLNASVSSRMELPRVRLWQDHQEDTLLDMQSPFWMEIRLLGRDGQPAKSIPLKEGYFEMTLPEALFKGQPRSISVSWIDFYRN